MFSELMLENIQADNDGTWTLSEDKNCLVLAQDTATTTVDGFGGMTVYARLDTGTFEFEGHWDFLECVLFGTLTVYNGTCGGVGYTVTPLKFNGVEFPSVAYQLLFAAGLALCRAQDSINAPGEI